MKVLITTILLIWVTVTIDAQTKRFPFNYPSGKDSTGKPIYKQGLTDASGKLVVYPYYDFLNWDEELNLAKGAFSDKNKKQFHGYIDSTGFAVIPFKYDNLGWFNNDNIAQYYNKMVKRESFNTGNYSEDNLAAFGLGSSNNGIYSYSTSDKIYGFINMNGTEILKNIADNPIYRYNGPIFSEGLVPISEIIFKTKSSLFLTEAEKKKRTDLINSEEGAKRFDLVLSYGNTQFKYHDIYGKPALKGINNSEVDSLLFIDARQFYKGLAAVRYPGANWKKQDQHKRRNDLCLIDKTGKIVVPPKYYDIENYYEGTPKVSIYDSLTKRSYFGLIDSTGKEIVPTRYVNIENYFKDYASVAMVVDQTNKKVLWGIVDKKTGKEIIPCKYEAVDGMYEGMAAVWQGGRWGFVNLKGEMVIAPKYVKESTYSSLRFKEGLAIVTTDTGLNKKYGAIDKTGKTVIPFIYDQLYPFEEGLAAANKGKILKRGIQSWQIETEANGKMGYITKTGKTAIPFEYDGGYAFNKGYATVFKDSIRFMIDKTGKNTLVASPRTMYAYNTGQIEMANKNYSGALKYLNEASAGGYAEADYSLGLMYYTGSVATPKNLAEALRLWNKAATQNSADAQYGLAFMYAKGEGVAASTTDALAWYTRAAALNHPDALCDLGVLNETGQLGVLVNLVESIKYYTKAANLGSPRGMHLMGLAYYNGKGVTKNMQTCRTWLEKAAAKGYKPAQDAIKQYGGMMK